MVWGGWVSRDQIHSHCVFWFDVSLLAGALFSRHDRAGGQGEDTGSGVGGIDWGELIGTGSESWSTKVWTRGGGEWGVGGDVQAPLGS